MSNNRRAQILDHIVSPYGLAMISYAFFLFACLIPPSLYSYYISEPDFMFLDPATILFYTLCVTAFVVGAWFIGWLMGPVFVEETKFRTKVSPTAFLVIPLTFGIAITLISDVRLIRSSPSIILFLLSQQGQDLKNAIGFGDEGNVTLPFVMLIGITWWAFWRYSDLRLRGGRRVLILALLWIAMLSVIISTVVTLSRSLLMVAICGLAILYVTRKALKRQITFRFLWKGSIAIAACTALPFCAFSFLRGSNSWDDQIYLLLGYTVASYNRLAVTVNGVLRSPAIDMGVNLSPFFAFNKSFNRLIPLNALMNWRDNVDIFDWAFGATSAAGLDGHLVWSGAFGAIFLDLKWFSCFFVLGYGMLYGLVWNWIKRGKALGVVLYPNLGFCVLFWLGSNQLLSSDSAVLFVTAILLAMYELIFMKVVRISGPNYATA